MGSSMFRLSSKCRHRKFAGPNSEGSGTCSRNNWVRGPWKHQSRLGQRTQSMVRTHLTWAKWIRFNFAGIFCSRLSLVHDLVPTTPAPHQTHLALVLLYGVKWNVQPILSLHFQGSFVVRTDVGPLRGTSLADP